MAHNPMATKQIWGTELTANDSAAKEELGIIRWEYNSTYGLRGFRYMQAAADTTVADGTALAFSDLYRKTCTSDISDADNNQPAGVGIGAITASYYGWVQCYGYHDAVATNGDDDIADGDHVILDGTNDGVCDSVAAGTAATDTPLGIAVDADVDGDDTVEVFLNCV